MQARMALQAGEAERQRRRRDSEAAVEERIGRIDTYDVAGDLERQLEAGVDEVGKLARGLVDQEDTAKAIKVACAGEKYTVKTESLLHSMESQLVSLFDKLDSVELNCVHANALKQQIEATLQSASPSG